MSHYQTFEAVLAGKARAAEIPFDQAFAHTEDMASRAREQAVADEEEELLQQYGLDDIEEHSDPESPLWHEDEWIIPTPLPKSTIAERKRLRRAAKRAARIAAEAERQLLFAEEARIRAEEARIRKARRLQERMGRIDALLEKVLAGDLTGDEEEDTCAICTWVMLPSEDIRRLPCHESHCFHRECIFAWLKKRDTCPNCRVVYSFYAVPNWDAGEWIEFVEDGE